MTSDPGIGCAGNCASRCFEANGSPPTSGPLPQPSDERDANPPKRTDHPIRRSVRAALVVVTGQPPAAGDGGKQGSKRTGGTGWRSGDPLPQVDWAWDVRERFDNYLLDPQKSGGKSQIFKGYGLKKGDGSSLERQIREQVKGKPVRLAPKSQQGDPSWGQRFYIDVEIRTPSGRPLKLTGFFRMKPDGPQMTNALPTDMVK